MPTMAEKKKAARMAGPLTFGKWLYAQRKIRGETLATVSKEIGITPGFLCALERDEREPGDRCVEEVARVYEVSLPWLMALLGRVPRPVQAALRAEPTLGLLLEDFAGLDPDSMGIMVELLQKMVDGARRRQAQHRREEKQAG